MTGTLALIGRGAFGVDCSFDAGLLESSGGTEVLVLPTGAAFEDPAGEVAAATEHFERLGARVRGLDVLTRRDALDQANAAAVAAARFVYVVGGSPMHLKSVLFGSPVWDAIVGRLDDGAVVAGADGAAMAFGDPMVDPRGGAFTIGLGLLTGVTAVPAFSDWSEDRIHRTRTMTPPGLVLAGLDRATALIRDPDGSWRGEGAGAVTLFRDGRPATFDDLAEATGI